MTLEEMGIKEKIFALRQCISKADSDTSYASSSALGDDRVGLLNKMNVLCDNATELFVVGRVNQLDFDQRTEAQAKYNSDLEEALTKFPEYAAKKGMRGR